MIQNSSKRSKKGFFYVNNSYLLTCHLCQDSLLLILVPEYFQDKDNNNYFKKQYTNQYFTKDSFSIFQNIFDFFQALDFSKQNKNITLTNSSFTLELQVFNKKIKKTFQLQKFKFTLQLKCIIQAKQSLFKQKGKQSSTLTNNSCQLQNGDNIQKLQNLQRQLIRKNQQIITMKKQIKQLLLIVNQQKKQLKTIKSESDSQEDKIFQLQDKKQIKQNKKLNKLQLIQKNQFGKQSLEKHQEFKSTLYDFLTDFLKNKFKQIQSQIQTHNQQHKLNLTQKLIEYSIDFVTLINFPLQSIKILKQCNLTNIQILILQNNNLCDIGWKTLLQVNLPKLKVLSVGNNNLKNIQFNQQISRLQKIYLADNQKIYKFFNILSRQTLYELLKFQWLNIRFLSITFRKYCDVQKREIEEDNTIWTQFIRSQLQQFPALKVLHVGNIDLQKQVAESLQNLCGEKKVKLQKWRKDLI